MQKSYLSRFDTFNDDDILREAKQESYNTSRRITRNNTSYHSGKLTESGTNKSSVIKKTVTKKRFVPYKKRNTMENKR